MTARVSEGTHSGNLKLSDWATLIVIACIWGSSFFLIATGLDSMSAAVVGFCRIACGALALSCIPSARRVTIDKADWKMITLLGAIWMAIPLLAFPIAEQWISSALAGMLNGGVPVVTAVVGVALGLKHPARIQQVGLVVGLAGIVLISLPSLQLGGNDAAGVGVVAIALVCYAFSATFAVPLQHKYGGPALMLRVEAIGAVLACPVAIATFGDTHFAWKSVLAVMVLGVLGTGVAFALMASVIGRVGATRATMVTYLMPPVSIALGVIVRNETVSGLGVVGVVIVLIGAFLLSRQPAAVDSPTSDD